MSITCKTAKNIILPCPCCGAEEAGISVNLHTLEDEAFTCNECENTFTLDSVRTFIRRWTAIVAWVGTVPTFDE